MKRQDESGFTIIEALVAILLLSILSIGFYQVMLSAVRGSEDASVVAEVAEEARLGFNRMIRDTRETTQMTLADDDRYRIWCDFDGDGLVDDTEYEYLEYTFDGERITLGALSGPVGGDPELLTGAEAPLNATPPETLAGNVRMIDGTVPVFSYVSNFLIFDTITVDGEATVDEIEANTVGDDNGVLTGVELDYVSDVNYSFEISIEGSSREFYGQAQIRNRRYSDL